MLNYIKVDKRKRIPLHQQIAFQLQEAILTNRFPNHSTLPSYDEFFKRFKLKREEVDLIIGYLSSRNLLTKSDQNYITNTPIVSTRVVGRFKGIFPVIEAIGLTPSIKDISIEVVEQVHFDYEGKKILINKAYKIERLYLGSDRPLIYYEGLIPYDMFPNFLQTNFRDKRLYDVFEKDYGYEITKSVRMVSGRTLTPYEANLLQYPIGSSSMVIHLLNYNQKQELIELSKLVALADYLHIDQEIN